jgi:hypothetical protein
MTFYIPDFWVGVIATILAEAVVIVIAAIVNSRRRHHHK